VKRRGIWIAVAVVGITLTLLGGLLITRGSERASGPQTEVRAAQDLVRRYLAGDPSTRLRMTSVHGLSSLDAGKSYPPVILASGNTANAEHSGFKSVVAVDVTFAGLPMFETFEVVETSGGEWLLFDHGD
jgi:hypothetical protein